MMQCPIFGMSERSAASAGEGCTDHAFFGAVRVPAGWGCQHSAIANARPMASPWARSLTGLAVAAVWHGS